jgi:hypothetical protein
MPSRGRQLDGPLRLFLAVHLGQVVLDGLLAGEVVAGRRRGRDRLTA